MDWRLKAARHAALHWLPLVDPARRLKRRLWGYAPNTGNLQSTIADLYALTRASHDAGHDWSGATVLEIGSGWFPIIPILLSLRGARHVLMTDRAPQMDALTFATTVQFLRQQRPDLGGRLSTVGQPAELGLDYRAPFDPADLPDGSLDCVISRTVLEHIQPAPLAELLRKLRPKLKPSGWMVHLVDHTDHYSHGDAQRSRIAFLGWTPAQHRRICAITRGGENRLRHHQYAEIFESAGFALRASIGEPHAPTLAELRAGLPLAEPFASMAPEDLAVLHSIYVAEPMVQAGTGAGDPGAPGRLQPAHGDADVPVDSRIDRPVSAY